MSQKTAEDLLTPQGDIEPNLLFPGTKPDVINAQLTAWLIIAYAALPAETVDNVVRINEGAMHYAYYKAFEQAHRRMSLSPLRSTVANEASDGYDFAQIREVAAIAASHFDSYNEILSGYAELVAPATARVSQAVKNKFVF